MAFIFFKSCFKLIVVAVKKFQQRVDNTKTTSLQPPPHGTSNYNATASREEQNDPPASSQLHPKFGQPLPDPSNIDQPHNRIRKPDYVRRYGVPDPLPSEDGQLYSVGVNGILLQAEGYPVDQSSLPLSLDELVEEVQQTKLDDSKPTGKAAPLILPPLPPELEEPSKTVPSSANAGLFIPEEDGLLYVVEGEELRRV